VEQVVRHLGVSERKACAVLGQHRSTQRKAPRAAEDETALMADIVELAKRYGRYGYRRITALLRNAGWTVNRKRVERLEAMLPTAGGGAEGAAAAAQAGQAMAERRRLHPAAPRVAWSGLGL
jgi:transposase InsO family protein